MRYPRSAFAWRHFLFRRPSWSTCSSAAPEATGSPAQVMHMKTKLIRPGMGVAPLPTDADTPHQAIRELLLPLKLPYAYKNLKSFCQMLWKLWKDDLVVLASMISPHAQGGQRYLGRPVAWSQKAGLHLNRKSAAPPFYTQGKSVRQSVRALHPSA